MLKNTAPKPTAILSTIQVDDNVPVTERQEYAPARTSESVHPQTETIDLRQETDSGSEDELHLDKLSL